MFVLNQGSAGVDLPKLLYVLLVIISIIIIYSSKEYMSSFVEDAL